MIAKKIEVLIPADIDDCLSSLAKYSGDCAPLAGGTDLVVLLKTGMRKHIKYLLDISSISDLKVFTITLPGTASPTRLGIDSQADVIFEKLKEWRELAKEGNGAPKVTLGSTHTHSAIATSPLLKGFECLIRGASSIGSPQIRNMGTIGGNLANASPAADLYPPLIALGATATLVSHRGVREIAVEDLPRGPGSTLLEPYEILTSVTFEIPSLPFYSSYIKIGLRNSLAISVASAAVFATFDGGKFKTVRVACGAVAPTPIRMREVENLLIGQSPSRQLAREAGEIASKECDPISDIRATRTYRRHVTSVIVSRLIEDAAERGGRFFGEQAQ